MLHRIILIVTLSLFAVSVAWANPTEEVKKTVDEVVRIVADKDLKNSPAKRRQALKKAIGAIFDYSEMAKRSLGKHWNQLAPEEREQFKGHWGWCCRPKEEKSEKSE